MRNIILHLSLIEGIGPAIVKHLLEKVSEPLDVLYRFSVNDFKEFNFSESLSTKLKIGLEEKSFLEKELSLIEKHKISWTTFIDDDYPELLKNIHLPPTIIYWQGKEFNDADKRIAIIGSRKANSYAKKIIDSLSKPLIENNWTIVSGGALGADTMAHEAALNYGGKTISILGSGLLKPYPSSNKKLFAKIIENNGTILSSFPLTFEALPGNFPARNRIISGISKGCVVIQASIKSGTRITALHALEQGRDVFAIPGSIDDELSKGCHKLIQEGAKLVTCAQDILEEYGENVVQNSNSEIKSEDKKVLTIEDQIIAACRLPITIDELSCKIDLQMSELQMKLFELQLNGKLKQNFAGLWQS